VPAPVVPYDEVIERLLQVFRDCGYAGASIAQIADATGLGRSSLYHYFPGGKDDMARAVIKYVDAWMDENALAPLRSPGPPAKRLKAMLDALNDIYEGGSNACLLGTFVLGNSRKPFQRELQAVFAAWVDALTALAIDAGISKAEAHRRAEDAVSRIQGSLILSAGLGNSEPFARMLRGINSEFLT